MSDRIAWAPTQHESKVESFYGSGIDGFHNYHNGYLNFGLWDRAGMTYEEAAEHMVRHMGERLGLNAQSRLLDVGCGMGMQDVLLHRTFGPQSIDGLDVTWKHVERARERVRREGLTQERMRFHHGTAVRLPFTDRQFSHLLSIEAPEHFDTRETFFYEAARVLEPGGVVALCDYTLARPPRHAVDRALVEFARALWEVPKANVYTNETYRQKMERAGFAHVVIDNVGARTIPGYYYEHRRPESIQAIQKIRGFWKGVVGGFLIDWGVFAAFRYGLLEYVIVRAERAHTP